MISTHNYATSKQDSIYHDLYHFLILKGDLPKSMDWILDCDSCEKYLTVFEVVSGLETSDFINIPFGIYKFQYKGCIDCGYYVLIKYNDTYKIYHQNNITKILEELIKIRKENSDRIDCKLLETYVEVIIDDKSGIYKGRSTICQTIGHIQYISNE
jgi:hypothetical protein